MMKGLQLKKHGSYDVYPTPGLHQSRFATLQDILDLAALNGCGATQAKPNSPLDFESSRVIIVNTKSRKSPRKRSLSLSPGLSSRGSSEASSSCGSVNITGSSCGSVNVTGVRSARDAGCAAGSSPTGGGGGGGLYNWMQSSLRRRLRKRAKKSACVSPPGHHHPPPCTPAAGVDQLTPDASTPDDEVAYVNHRNGTVTAVPISNIQIAVSASKVLAHSGRPRSRPSSVSSRVSTRVNRSNSINARETQSTKTTGGKTSKKRQKKVLGGAWGLFHCVGAGARSRSCTPERHVNYRVRSRSATPERRVNVRVNPGTAAGKTMKGRSKSKGRRRGHVETAEEYDKENQYDMWRLIREKLEAGEAGGTPERLSRRDTLPCRRRVSVDINREERSDDWREMQEAAARTSGQDKWHSQRLEAAARTSGQDTWHSHRLEAAAQTQGYLHRVPSIDVYPSERQPLRVVGGAACYDGSSRAGGLGGAGAAGEAVPPRRAPSTCSVYSSLNSLPARYRNRPLPPIPTAGARPPKPPESGIHLAKILNFDKFMKSKWISGIAVTRKNELVVVDLKEAYLIDEDGNLKRTIGTGKGPNSLKEPIDVAVMPNGNLVFSDHADQEVKIYNPKGQFLRKITDKCLANIAGVATGDKRQVYIAGTDKRCITVHSEDAGLLSTIPDKDTCSTAAKATFEHPYSIAVNPLTGDVIIGDDYKQLVVAVSSDGRVLWRYCPTGDRHFFPCSIAVDTEGYVFIADLYNEKIYMLDSSGKYLKTLLSRGDGLKGGPGAIAVDSRGHLIVADEERTVRIFKYSDKGFAMYRRFSLNPAAS